MQNKHLIVAIDGIGSLELSILRPFVQQALNDHLYLSKSSQEEEGTSSKSTATGRRMDSDQKDDSDPQVAVKFRIRRFR